jgi:hypothetical protein
MAMLETAIWPAVKFRLDIVGWGDPEGHRVKYPEALGLTTVTFNATAELPCGTLPEVPSQALAPTTWTEYTAPA